MAKMTPPPLLILILGLSIATQYCSADDVLFSPEALYSDSRPSLNYGYYNFTIQNDCNLVLYESGNPIWATNTGSLGRNCSCVMQSNGNLVVYNQNNYPVWRSNTNEDEDDKYALVLQSDRNVVLYGPALWSTRTQIGSYGVVVVAAQNSNSNPAAAAAAAGEVIADVGASDTR
ncbi:uncharacterized protein A4U43_C07F5990 [Asparagus officinalis]|uniref:Bulb-type lectin domain-containing protein n=2 Tax=Asparagus officinalis TaxID=4686 RepID=A0A5P1E9R1_ASPOF|nr:uncharacterized protein A4U43_C07F5990 [Asparagus officinalis]